MMWVGGNPPRRDLILTIEEWERIRDMPDFIGPDELHDWLASWLGAEKAEELHDFVRSVPDDDID